MVLDFLWEYVISLMAHCIACLNGIINGSKPGQYTRSLIKMTLKEW